MALDFWDTTCVMKIKSFQIEVKKPKSRGFAIPPNRVIKDKTQYNRKQKHKGGYELWQSKKHRKRQGRTFQPSTNSETITGSKFTIKPWMHGWNQLHCLGIKRINPDPAEWQSLDANWWVWNQQSISAGTGNNTLNLN